MEWRTMDSIGENAFKECILFFPDVPNPRQPTIKKHYAVITIARPVDCAFRKPSHWMPLPKPPSETR